MVGAKSLLQKINQCRKPTKQQHANMTKNQELIKLKNLYKQETKEEDISVPAFVAWLRRRGYQMPEPPTVDQVLGKQIVKALEEEVRHDEATGEIYKVNVSFAADSEGNGVLWTDVDEAPRKKMVKVVGGRRKQIVNDAVQLELIVEHWNRKNPDDEPLAVEYDLGFDVLLSKSERDVAMAD